MNFISRCVEAVKRFDNRFLFVGPQVFLGRPLADIFSTHHLVIADVGAAGGVESRWRSLQNYCRFLTFEPQPEEVTADPRFKNFAICLGARKEERVLHLTAFSQSSSMYANNMERLKDFAMAENYQVVKDVSVRVDTLDNCLADAADWTPDFLKIDVEGAELDVLKGAGKALEQILGLRVEVSFLRRHLGAPLFADVDSFLRDCGFELFIQTRESMIRGNLVHMPLSQPQLVWGDSIYFLNKKTFLDRLSRLSKPQCDVALTKFVCVLLSYWIHDYPIEIIEAAEAANFVSPKIATELKETVRKSAGNSGVWLLKAFGGVALAALIYIGSLPSRQARRSATFYFKQRAGYLTFYFWRMTARGGGYNSSVSDLLM